MRVIKLMITAAFLLTCILGFAQAPAAKSEAKMPSKTPGFDVKAMDKSVDPCTDFYQFACGGWRTANPVPADQSRWGRFNELADRNNDILKEILDKAAAGGASRNAVDQKIGDYYGACMDEEGINQKGLAPLNPVLTAIAGMKSKSDLTAVVTMIHRMNGAGFFNFGSGQDFKNSSSVIAQMDQGGLGLPNRDYYFNDDAKSKEQREKYIEHVTKMLTLAGSSTGDAAAGAKVVLAIETDLAGGSLTPVERRDPEKLYHMMSVKDLQAMAPSFDFAKYFQGVGAGNVQTLNVAVPAFATAMEKTLGSHNMSDVQTYLKWHVLRNSAALLPASFVNENFDFYGKTLRGAKELRPRWKRCVQQTDNALGEALGIAYVQKAYGPAAAKRMKELVQNLETALKTDIEGLEWMSPVTKKKAVEKLAAIANKVGYPEKWRDYSSVNVVKGDALGNAQRANAFEVKRQFDKIGKPVDKKEWGMTPPTVNAYYDPQMNNINFPAGILQPPFFEQSMDDAVNYGGIGAVIGHELTHGFDDEGSQFDSVGNLADWWSADDKKAFKERTSCIVDEYNSFPVDDLKVNGQLTLGENTADNGGLRIAYMALLDSLKGKKVAPIDGFTPQQRIFLGWGQIWCQNSTPQAARLQVKTDPHSPGQYRVNGVVRNMPEFQKAFSCKAGSPMAPEKACHVW